MTKLQTVVSDEIIAAIDRFDEAAQSHGWEADQGSASDADAAERKYACRRVELIAIIGRHLRRLAEISAERDRTQSAQ